MYVRYARACCAAAGPGGRGRGACAAVGAGALAARARGTGLRNPKLTSLTLRVVSRSQQVQGRMMAS